MRFVFFVLSLLPLSAQGGEPKKTPLFDEPTLNRIVEKVKKNQQLPLQAVDMLFDFYRKNRASSGGLQDTSCIDKKEYKTRYQDGDFKKNALKSGIQNETCLCLMDYTRPKTEKRGHCIFLSATSDPVIDSFVVAHGSGSAESKGCPTTFTNALTSTGTTLSGLFLTSQDTYTFRGKAKGVGAYSSTGLTLYGVENSNWTAANVGKATHGAPYVTDGPQKRVGRSLGCPAMTVEQAKKTLPLCKGQAAWLNYTFATQAKTDFTPESCK